MGFFAESVEIINRKVNLIKHLPFVLQIKIRRTVNGLTSKWFNDADYLWMKNRILSMKNAWSKAVLSLGKKRPLTERTKKKVLSLKHSETCMFYNKIKQIL